MTHWRPTLSEFVAPFAKVRSWDMPLERYGSGIDNAHIDVYLSASFRDKLGEMVRELILEDAPAQLRQMGRQQIDAQDLKTFRECYLGMYKSILEQPGAGESADRLALLQISILKCLLQVVTREKVGLQDELKDAENDAGARSSGRNLEVHEHLVALTRDKRAVHRRVLTFLFRQVRRLEDVHAQKIRASVVGDAWPFPRRAFFNPVLLIPDLKEVKELAPVYPIASLGEGGGTDWLFHTNQCVSTVFQNYLPGWTRLSARPRAAAAASASPARERRDQGQLKGFLGTEMLLHAFVPEEEYRSGRCSWLDEPRNLRMFLASDGDSCDAPEPGLAHSRESEFTDARFSGISESEMNHRGFWSRAGWRDFRIAVVDELFRCLDLNGLGPRIVLLYWLPSMGKRLGRPIPLSLVVDFVEGRLPRRRLAQRLESLSLALDPASVARVLENGAAQLRSLGREERSRFCFRYLTDFLLLRRDLKLAYKTYEAMDRICLLEDPQDVQLSRANTSLYAFYCGDDQQRSTKRRIQAHAVIKADVRGSTLITERLRAKGLNPASHFGLNFFGPVNQLLPEFAAEKLFVEGDAMILGLFEYEGEPAGLAVARACALARKILQVVSLQNVINRKHELPDLELGLGISYSPWEPNFLYDEGHRIMISGAINRADRLSSCSAELREGPFRPESQAFRVSVVIDCSHGRRAIHDGVFLGYNVNGVKLEKAAFFKLQKELHLHQVSLPEEEMADSLFFVGSFPDLSGRVHWLVLRYAPVHEWDGRALGGAVAPSRKHFFELIVDEALSARVRRLAEGDENLFLRGRA